MRSATRAGGVWTREDVLERIARFAALRGRPPTVMDWSPTVARRRGRPEVARRFHDEGCWPHASTVSRIFGSWRGALHEAGHRSAPPGAAAAREAWLAEGLVSTTDIAAMAGVSRFDVRRPLARSGLRPAEVRGRTALYRRGEAEAFARGLREARDARSRRPGGAPVTRR